jgi:hypothetical protein
LTDGLEPVDRGEDHDLVVVLNWHEELKARVPTGE